jgi:uncharacterized protein YoxC
MQPDLSTTNLLLGIMAAVSVLEALAVIGVGWAAWAMYSRSMALISRLEERHVAPLVARVDGILADVKGVTAEVNARADGILADVKGVTAGVNARVDGILADVKGVTAEVKGVASDVKGVTGKVKVETERVDQAIRSTIDRVDDAATRWRTSARFKARRLVAIVAGVRAAARVIQQFRHRPPAQPFRHQPPASTHAMGRI